MFDDATPGGLLPLGLVLVVSLAGCSVAGVPLGSPTPYTDSGAALDGDSLREDHERALRDAGSFRASTNLTLQHGDGRVRVNRTAVVDVETNRSRATSRLAGGDVDGDGLVVTTYTENETSARRVVLDGDDGRVVGYEAAREPYDDGFLSVSPVNPTRQANGDVVAVATDEVDWAQRGVERHDGVWVTRYEASGVENVSDVGAIVAAALTDGEVGRTDVSPGDVDASAVNATLLVDQDGVVRLLELTVVATTDDGEAVTLNLAVTTDGVGATAVDRPPWYGDATDDLPD